MAVEFKIPAGTPDCPRHPGQPDGFCTPCAADASRAASIRYAGSRAAAAAVLDSMTGPQITALTDELGFAAAPGLSTEELRNRALNAAWPPADEPTPGNRLARLFRAVYAKSTARRDARWLDAPCGCCECGTGGPYYDGDAPQVVRYLYAGAMLGGRADRYDWSSCSQHPLDCGTLIIDYGTDVVKTCRETEADAAAAGYLR